MFADDRNLLCFFFKKDIKQLFQAVNSELEKTFSWFKTNRLSLNDVKTKYTLFNKSKNKVNIPLKPPKLHLNQKQIQRYHSYIILNF